ncbi:hypothetical protein ACFFGT_10140 [Mucilaginibacter angelicae]|uniref:Glycosyltransferase subfamily 4-like N-terminal domain-containing protein n=1 Tax=Mucilaginibacter angelicae TaxID=869718 RepID=A0ABV6L512_9SPHI
MKNITLITTGQPTTNPRLVKEAETLISQGYRVKVICCFYQSWALQYDEEITSKYPGVYVYCGGDPLKGKMAYVRSRLRQKLSLLLFKYLKYKGAAENAISRTHTEALSLAKSIQTDLYIAHNLGALPAAVKAARKQGVPVGYDAEDMHTGQYLSGTDAMYRLNKYIEEQYFPRTSYFTAASPLIAEYYAARYNYLAPLVINNVFPKTPFGIRQHVEQGGPLKLFWFSQTVGPERGIETIVKAMAGSPGRVELHLLGNCSARDKEALLSLAGQTGLMDGQLYFHDPVPAGKLFSFAAQFDIGMATETGVPLNRDICLTNKVFTYIQCGLAMIASDTQAQKLFLQQYPDSGKLYRTGDEGSLRACIDAYLISPELLHRTRSSNYRLGQTELNWESESRHFLKLIETI